EPLTRRAGAVSFGVGRRKTSTAQAWLYPVLTRARPGGPTGYAKLLPTAAAGSGSDSGGVPTGLFLDATAEPFSAHVRQPQQALGGADGRRPVDGVILVNGRPLHAAFERLRDAYLVTQPLE